MKQTILILLAALLIGPWILAGEKDIPPRPEGLTFPDLTFDVPDAQGMRVELENGIPVYILEDRLLPLITIQIQFRGGDYLDPEGKEGLAGLTGTVWRTGGAGDLDATAFDEEIDFLAAQLSTGIGSTSGQVRLNLLSKDLDRGLELLMDVVQRPRFEESRITRAKEDLLAAMKQRNDSTTDIESREWNRLIYGDDYWLNRLSTQSSVAAITRQDLVDFQKRLAFPANLVVAVAGDFQRQAMLDKLNETLGQWQETGEAVPPIPQPDHQPQPGVYLVNKPEVNQGRVSIGHLGWMRPLEDEFDMGVGNDILGGGGFTSRIVSRVRSDEGLAYSAGSRAGINNTYPGTFRAFFQSKSATCARAAQLILDLVEELQNEGVTEKELETSKNSFIQTFPNNFQSKLQVASIYAQDELVGLPHEYWQTYRDRVRAVTAESLRDSVRKHIRKEEFVILVVGNIEEILKGHPDFPEIRFETMGNLTRLPLRDPMTLEPLSE